MLIDNGAPPRKLILGIPTYGRSWALRAPRPYSPMQPPVPAKGAAPAGFITKAVGSMGYMEICLKVKNAGWVEVDDPEGPYAYSMDKTIWVGYDTPGSAADKANYIIQRGLGGAMIWDLPQDDFSVRNIFHLFLAS
jgi:chitinase